MTKYIKFIMSSGDGISVPMEQADKILKSEGQLVRIISEDGLWTGQVVNKAHIVLTDRDRQREKIEAEAERMKLPKLDEPKMSPEKLKANQKKIDDIRKNLIHKKVIKK